MTRNKYFVVILAALLVTVFPVLGWAQIAVSLPQVTGPVGQTVSIPLTVGSLTGQNVTSYDLTLDYDAAILTVTGITVAGTISEGMTIVTNTDTPGQIKVSAASITVLEGAGTLLNLSANLLGPDNSALTLTFTFNEGVPGATVTNGSVTVGRIPIQFAEEIKGDVGETGSVAVTIGDLEFASPDIMGYTFTISYDPAIIKLTGVSKTETVSAAMTVVANTATTGQLTVSGAGVSALTVSGTLLNIEYELVALGNSDLTWTSFVFNEGLPNANTKNGKAYVGGVDVILPTQSITLGADAMLPISISDATARNIYSYTFTFTYDNSVVDVTGVSATGTLSEGWTIVPNLTVAGQVTVSAAGTAALTGEGALLNLETTPLIAGNAAMTWTSFVFNEGAPTALEEDGIVTVTVNAPPTIAADPTEVSVLEEAVVTVNVTTGDADGHTVVVTMTNAPATATLVEGVFTWTTTHADVGTKVVTFTANDGHGGTASATASITVTAFSAPTITVDPVEVTVMAGEGVIITVTTDDADGHDVVVTMTGAPEAATLVDGVFSWTTTEASVGTTVVTFTADDGHGGTATATATIIVNSIVPPPEPVDWWLEDVTFGPSGQSPQYGAVDADGKLWVTNYGTPGTAGVYVWNADMTVASFSPILTGLDENGAEIAVSQLGGVVVYQGIVYIVCYNQKKILRFKASDGTALNGWAVAYGPGDIDVDQAGNIFIGHKVEAMFSVYNTAGKELTGSPFGAAGWHINRGMSVTKDGSKVFLADESSDVIALWEGSVTSGVAAYTQSANFMEGLIDPSACEIDPTGRIWISNWAAMSAGGSIMIAELDGTVLQTIPAELPRGAAFDFVNGYAYIIHYTSAVPMITRFVPGYPSLTIAEARADNDGNGIPDWQGKIVKIKGIVTTPNYQGTARTSYYMQDETAGINLFNYDVTYTLNMGDEVEAVGDIFSYYGLEEIQNAEVTVLSTGNPLPAAQVITLAQVGEEYESELVTVENIWLAEPISWAAEGSNASVLVTDGVDTVIYYIDKDTDLDGWADAPRLWESFSVTSIVDYYNVHQLKGRTTAEIYNRVDVDETKSLLPDSYALSQNYPNPFNPTTTIEYALPMMSRVNIVVYNMMGQIVSELVNNVQEPGLYHSTWNARDMSSGVYFVQITAKSTDGKETFNSVKKMMLLK